MWLSSVPQGDRRPQADVAQQSVKRWVEPMSLQGKKNILLKASGLSGVDLWSTAKPTDSFIHLSYAVRQAECRWPMTSLRLPPPPSSPLPTSTWVHSSAKPNPRETPDEANDRGQSYRCGPMPGSRHQGPPRCEPQTAHPAVGITSLPLIRAPGIRVRTQW